MKLKYISSLISILSLFCCSPLSAQISYDEDWAGFSRYSEANAKVTHQPNAVPIMNVIKSWLCQY